MHSEDDLDTLNRRMLKMGADSAALDEFQGSWESVYTCLEDSVFDEKSQAQGVKDGEHLGRDIYLDISENCSSGRY